MIIRLHQPRFDEVGRCTICGMSYCPDLAEDRRQHDRKCCAAQAARNALADTLPFDLPLSYQAREEMKRDLSGGSVTHMERVMLAHFARSLAAADYNVRQHPSWLRYARAYLANPSLGQRCGMESLEALKARYGTEEGSCLADLSYWAAAGDRLDLVDGGQQGAMIDAG